MKKLIGIMMIILISSFNMNIKSPSTITGKVVDQVTNQGLANVNIAVKGTDIGTITDQNGKFKLEIIDFPATLLFNATDYQDRKFILKIPKENLRIGMKKIKQDLLEVVEEDMEFADESFFFNGGAKSERKVKSMGNVSRAVPFTMMAPQEQVYPDYNTEEYDAIQENIFHNPRQVPLSTFSIDVDAASYSNVRRMINTGQKPYVDMVRIEEMINYFDYDYTNPKGEHPFSITTEVAQAPWNKQHQLVHIGLQGKKVDYENTDPANLVFLVDVSGSMSSANKLPLLKSALKMLVNQLGAKDRVAIVAYAGAAGLVLPPTPASEKSTIISALDRLKSGGSTAGGQGIKLAYKVAEENLIEEGNNRVILATDGDFNIGISSTSEMVRLIEEKRKSGIFLTITGFGMGNYKDGRMEQISNAGNGNYYYIDNLNEARKVFVTEMQATLFTIAKDVKIQVEFNPTKVQAYRLIGYENRALKAEDFNDDKKDAGELGAGHTVTALYEIIPTGVESTFIGDVVDLKYQVNSNNPKNSNDKELLTVKFRYKDPKGTKSKLIAQTLPDRSIDINKTSDNFRFSASVAEFGMLLRDSEFKQNSTYQNVITLALAAKGKDKEGYRQEFINMVKSVQQLDKQGL